MRERLRDEFEDRLDKYRVDLQGRALRDPVVPLKLNMSVPEQCSDILSICIVVSIPLLTFAIIPLFTWTTAMF